jgi:hypothetical protein
MQSTSKLLSMVHESEKNYEHVQWSLFQAMHALWRSQININGYLILLITTSSKF